MTGTRRARSAVAKELRRQVLVDAASGLVTEIPLADITMEAVAQRAKLAKGTLYLYFQTKEELLLALLSRHLEKWFDSVEKALDGTDGNLSVDAFLAILAEAFGDLAQTPALMANLSTLESNCGLEHARRYKRWLWVRMVRLGSKLEARLPGLESGGGFRLLMHLHALVAGVYQVTHPGETMRGVIDELELHEFKRDFYKELGYLVQALLGNLAVPGGRTGARATPRGRQSRRRSAD